MNDYEVLLMLDPELSDERGTEIVTRVREQAEADGGTWDGHEPWGRRRLAFEIDHKPEGVYHLLFFTTVPTALEEITRVLKITDGVMRHLAVRRVKGGSMKAPAPIAALAVAAAAPAEAAPAPVEPTPATATATPSPAAEAPAQAEAAPAAAESATAESAQAKPASAVEAVSETADDTDAAAE
jgi:small subunit ribosomal protein S6